MNGSIRTPHRVAPQRRRPRNSSRDATSATPATDLVAGLCFQRRATGRKLTASDVRRARELVGRCAGLSSLKRYIGHGEALPAATRRRIGRKLTGTERDVYGLVRRAVANGKAGLAVTVDQLAWKLDRCERSIQYALESLGDHRRACAAACGTCEGCRRPCGADCTRHVDLVRAVPQFDDVAWSDVARQKTYHRRQTASAYVLGRAARRPSSGRKNCTPKPFSSSLRSEEKEFPVDKSCGQPGQGRGVGAGSAGAIDDAANRHDTIAMKRHAHALAERADKHGASMWLSLAGETATRLGAVPPGLETSGEGPPGDETGGSGPGGAL